MVAKYTPFRLTCESIDYRKGFIEVIPGIHKSCINLETWEIVVDANLEGVTRIDDSRVTDSQVIANTELELTVEQACLLAEALLKAANLLKM